MTPTWKIALVAAATAVGSTTAVVALTDRGAAPASATVPPDGDGGEQTTDRPERSVSVSGHGTVEVQPDLAELTMGVTSTDPGAATVYSTIQTESQTLVESLKGLGIAAEDIQTSGLNIYPNIDDNQISSFVGNVDVRVTIRDLAKLGEVVDGVQAFVGPELTLSGISFSYAEPEQVLADARRAAVENARDRADQYATAADGSVGEVLQIIESGSVSVPLLERTMGAAEDAAASIAIEPGSQELSADVTVVFALT